MSRDPARRRRKSIPPILILIAVACSNREVLDSDITPSAEPAVFVVNSRGETLSRILLDQGTVVRDAIALGSVPNAIAFAGDGHRGFVACSGSNRIDVIDLDGLRLLTWIDIGAGSNPYAIAVAGDQAYVSCFLSDEVVHVNLGTGRVVRRIPLPRSPEGLLLGDESQGTLYVAVTNYAHPTGPFGRGEVAVIDVEADTVRIRLGVGTNPQNLASAPDGTIHVICTGDYGPREGRVFVIDPEIPAVVDSLDLGGAPGAVAVLADGRGVAAGYYGGLRYYDRRKRSVQPSRALSVEGLSDVACDRSTGLIYVTQFSDSAVQVVDPLADSLLATYGVGHGPVALAVRR